MCKKKKKKFSVPATKMSNKMKRRLEHECKIRVKLKNFLCNKSVCTTRSHGVFQTTWADFVFTVALENFENIFGATALENYPALRGLKKRVHEISAIADWLARRPHSEF